MSSFGVQIQLVLSKAINEHVLSQIQASLKAGS